MSPWGFGRRGARPTDITWMPEDLELAPDWIREQVVDEPEQLREWLTDQIVAGAQVETGRPVRTARRGRRPKHRPGTTLDG